MSFSNAEILWATQVALSRYQHTRSHVDTESEFRIFGVTADSKFSIQNVDGEKWIYATSIISGSLRVQRIPMFFSVERPDYDASLWRLVETIPGSITDACIEFDGAWESDYSTRTHRLVTEDVYWLFYVESGVLYARYGDTAPITLSDDAVLVSSVRGWVPIDGDFTNDQGLIVGYTKSDGKVYFRAYCKQVDGEKLWETETEIPYLSTPCTSLFLFRANDFRVGFAAVRGGSLYWTLTTRNYAGMSVWTDKISASISELFVAVTGLSYFDHSNDEHITTAISDMFIGAAEPIYPALVSLSNVLNDYRILIKLTHPVVQDVTSESVRSRFSVVDSIASTFAVTSTSAGENASEIYLNMVNFSSAKNPVTVTFTSGASEGVPSALTCNNGGLQFDVPSFSESYTALIEPPKGYATENITVAIASLAFVVSFINYRTMHRTENITASVSNISFVVTNVGGSPL